MMLGFVRVAIVTAAIAAGVAIAGVADLLTVFQSGEPILAEEVNGNFTTLAQQIDAANDATAALTQQVDTFQARFGETRTIAPGRGAECTLGDVWLTAIATFGPGIPADGRLLSIAQYTALFSLLGTTYGGDGRTTFALPDLRDVAPRSADGRSLNYVICVFGIFPSRL